MEKKVLIFGASGLVGRYLKLELDSKNYETIGTYFTHKSKGLIHFDFQNDLPEEIFQNENADFAIICSAKTKIDDCLKYKEESDAINVYGTKRVLSFLKKRGIFPIFISGASVFDGLGSYQEEDLKNPVNIYGKQKVEVEDFLVSNFQRYLILRPGKIFGIGKKEGLFSDMLERFKMKETIFCAEDEKFSLVYAGDFARGIEKLISLEKIGVYNLSPQKIYDRFELALEFFNSLGLHTNLEKCSISRFETLEKRARNSFIDSSKFLRETNFMFTDNQILYPLILQNDS